MKSDGTLLGKPDDDYERILSLREEVEKEMPSYGYYIRLVEFKRSETRVRLDPPPPDKSERIHGGHAIGGFTPRTLEDILFYFKRVFDKQYASKDVKFWIEENRVCAELDNVRCWVSLEDGLGIDEEYGVRKKWRAYVTMVKRWNDEYRNVHLGDFFSGTDAVEEAFIAFVRYQVTEQYCDEYF